MENERVIVLDTHALVWWLTGGTALSGAASATIARAASDGGVVASAISVLEIVTAVRRKRLQFANSVEQWLTDARSLPKLRFEPVSSEIAQLAGSFGAELHCDRADRIIAATAIHPGFALVTADEKLHASGSMRTIW